MRTLEGSYLAALNGILRKFLSFVPVGIIIAFIFSPFRRDLRMFGQFIAFIMVAGLAVGIELGQLFLPGRFASFDDALVCFAGAGWLLGDSAIRRVKMYRLATPWHRGLKAHRYLPGE